MRIIKTILPFLIFFFILACGQNPDRKLRNEDEQVVQNNGETEKDLVENDSTEGEEDQSQNPNFDWWMYGLVISLIFNVILILLLLKTVNAKNKYEWERDDMIKGKDKYKSQAQQYKNRLDTIDDKKKASNRRKNEFSTIKQVSSANDRKEVLEDKRSYEKEWSIKTKDSTNSEDTSPGQKILYAEKATDNKVFTSVSEQQNEYKSIFKLILDHNDTEKAEFEVLDSDYILKMVVNSPDTYLYPVCKPENSNQNYSREIVTTIKGVAHKIDGKWLVKDENKATIKFQ